MLHLVNSTIFFSRFFLQSSENSTLSSRSWHQRDRTGYAEYFQHIKWIWSAAGWHFSDKNLSRKVKEGKNSRTLLTFWSQECNYCLVLLLSLDCSFFLPKWLCSQVAHFDQKVPGTMEPEKLMSETRLGTKSHFCGILFLFPPYLITHPCPSLTSFPDSCSLSSSAHSLTS